MATTAPKKPRARKRPTPKGSAPSAIREPAELIRIAEQFEADVLDGRFPCGRLFRLAIERQRADLGRQNDGSFAYEFRPEVGAAVAWFLERLPHVEGPEEGEGFRLEPWQAWVVIVLYGWVNRVTSYPRFRRATLFMPKGNGKTFLAAGLALYPLCENGTGDKIFSAATTRDQARLSFETARQMLLRSPKLVEKYGLEVGKHAITQPGTGAAYKTLAAEEKSLEGIIPSLIIEDEIHAHPTREVHDNLRSSAAKRPDSQMIVISTAGFDMAPQAIGYEVYTYARDILLGSVKDDSQFALLIEADPEDDPWAEETWRKANPNYGVSIDPVEVANEANEARQRPLKQPSFFTKRLGWWVKSGAKWIAPADWDACFDPELRLEDFDGRQSYIGLDMGDTRDLTARVQVFVEIGEDGKRRYAVFSHCYLPKESITIREGGDELRIWEQQGWLTLTPGRSMGDDGLQILQDDLLDDAARNPRSELCYDPFRAQYLVDVTKGAIQPVEVRQGAKTQSDPMKELEAAILDRRIRHQGDPLLAWCLCNIVTRADRNGNIAPDRESEGKKIDAGVALINAFVRARLSAGSSSVYSTERGLVSI